MGLFDQVLSVASSFSSQDQGGSSLLSSIMQLATDPQTGGISGLIQAFQSGGLGEIVKSWISTGQNLPISAEQIQSILGSEQIQNIASRLGIDPTQAAGQLAEYLPQVVDQMTPNGKLPEGDLAAQGMELLKGKLFG